MSRTTEDSLKQAKSIVINRSSGQIDTGNFDSKQLYSVRLKQRSSLNLQLNKTTAELIQDRNRNARIDRGETIARSQLKRGINSLKADNLKQGTYFIRMGDAGSYQLAVSASAKSGSTRSDYGSWSAAGSADRSAGYQYLSLDDVFGGLFGGKRISTSRWNGSFINRTSGNVTDYEDYNFSSPALNKDLGSRGKRGKVLAQLKTDFGTRSPGSGVQSDNYAMQAWTRVSLKSGQTYQISSNSNDGTRFFFRDRRSGRVVSSFEGDWRDNGGEWTQAFSVGEGAGGSYDFYVQHYEKTGTASVNVRLEKAQLSGKVVTSSLNLRSKPSTVNNTPIASLSNGTRLTIVRKVESSNDSRVPDWYEVVTSSGRRGYVAAQSDLVQVGGDGSVATFGNGSIQGGTGGKPSNTPRPTGGGGSSSGKTSSEGVDLIKSFEGLRTTAYRDPVGVLTIGYGTTTGVYEGQRISEAQAEAFLKKDLERFEQAVKSSVKVSLNSDQFSALVSFTYNVGEGAMAGSTLVRYLNQGDYQGAADEFLRWNKGGGVELAGLTRRRNAERAMFLGQDYTAFL
jgi:GH24 family phage-related lysozyme (muramidase)